MNYTHGFSLSVGHVVAVVCLLIALAATSLAGSASEVLRVAVGKPFFLSGDRYQNRTTVAVSRTGIAAVFYPKNGTGPRFYRTSTDQGRTWSEEMEFPPQCTSFMSVGLKGGGVLFMTGSAAPVKDGKPGELEAGRVVFSDDFKTWEQGVSTVFIPDAALNVRWAKFWPPFDKGKIVQLTNGDLMAPMYGNFTGDLQYRTMFVKSKDQGKSWEYWDSIYYPEDPNPELFGAFCGYCEPSLALLPDGRFLAALRTQGAELSAEYRPIYMSWSDTMGKNWSKPIPTDPYLENIWPTLAVLDNGVVACQYGRPGVHMAFSLDNGRTWSNRVSFSDLPEPIITGQGDIVKVGPNRLIAVANDASGTQLWTIDVDRVKLKTSQTRVSGRITDSQGKPIAGAKVELEPNRYTADTWVESDQFDHYGLQRMPIDPPILGYRAISEGPGHTIAKTNAHGEYLFKGVKLAEYVITIEADGCAPQWRHINVSIDPQQRTQDFALKPGRSVRGRVLDPDGKPVGGTCVVLDKLHLHADSDGWFSWAIEEPAPKEVAVRAYKRYNDSPGRFEGKLTLVQIEAGPIVLVRAK